MATKLSNPKCRAHCDARAACVVGPEHRYPDEEIRYHHGTATERTEQWLAPYRRLTLGLVPPSLLLRTYFFTFGRIRSIVSR